MDPQNQNLEHQSGPGPIVDPPQPVNQESSNPGVLNPTDNMTMENSVGANSLDQNKVNANQSQQETIYEKTNSFSVIGLICAFIFPLLGLILSIIALKQTKERQQKGHTMAIWGIVISASWFVMIVPLGIMAGLIITTASGIQQKARDEQRRSDINAVSGQLESFNAYKRLGYPVLTDLNNTKWRNTYLIGLDSLTSCDPLQQGANIKECMFGNKPKPNEYSYQTWESDGVTPCRINDSGKTCPKFTLTATLESTYYNNVENANNLYSKNSMQ
ncbi:MAG: DUF4190 domain-containing protein [Candidatus Saccharibacteria bacterium]